MHSFVKQTLAGFALVSSMIGCGAQSGGDASEYQQALITSKEAKINLPGASSETTDDGLKGALDTLGQVATMYGVTRGVTSVVNGSVFLLVAELELVVRLPPTSLTETSATWGPGAGNALSPVVYRLVVERASAGGHQFRLQARPKAQSNDSFVTVISGTRNRNGNPDRGTMTLDLDAANRLDPIGSPSTGTIAVTYQDDGTTKTLGVVFQSFVDGKKSPTPQAINASYTYTEGRNGDGTFRFQATADIGGGSGLESLDVSSRWHSDGSGRSDVSANGGDVPNNVTGKIAECWDTSYRRTYFSDNFTGAAAEGDATACVFPAP